MIKQESTTQIVEQEEFFQILGSLFFENYRMRKQILELKQALSELGKAHNQQLQEVKK